MSQPISIFKQLSSADADTTKEALNADYIAAGIDDEVVAVTGQVNNFFAITIPEAREVEFDASDDEKKNNFALFSAIALGPDYQGVDFVTAWEAEYAKIY